MQLTEPFVIIQDDCVPVAGFVSAADVVRQVVHNGLIAFCLQGSIHHNTRTKFWRAMEQERNLIELIPHNWIPAMALGWTPKLAQLALQWHSEQPRPARETADDGRLYYFVRWARVPVWATVPCLVDHADDVKSVANGYEGKRRPNRSTLALLQGDASEVAWCV